MRYPAFTENPIDNFGTVVGENPTPHGILALWAVNGLSIVCWECDTSNIHSIPNEKLQDEEF